MKLIFMALKSMGNFVINVSLAYVAAELVAQAKTTELHSEIEQTSLTNLLISFVSLILYYLYLFDEPLTKNVYEGMTVN